ncbi:hypothetical protein ACROYT_G010511 [Oculina patagonica]
MAISGPATFSTRSFYGSRARAQRERRHVPLIEPDFGDSDKESDYDEDEVANISGEESDYSSPSEDESGSDSNDDDVVADDDIESIEAEGEAAGSSKSGNTSQNVRWRKRQPVCYDVAFKGEPFPPPPLEDNTPLQYFKQFFDDDLIDLLVEQTNLYSVQTTGTSICLDHNEMEMYLAIMNHLKKDGFWAVATIRKDRLKGADKHLLAEKELKKNGRGSFDYVVEANSGVTVIRWFDNGLVQLLSNYIGNDLAAQARRWSKKEGQFINIDRPAMVVEYNSNMGGVDLCDMLMSMYRVCHRSTKYYMHIVFYCIGVAIVNGWLLYRRQMTQKNVSSKNHMSLLLFQSEIAVGLCKAGKTTGEVARPRGRPSSTSPASAAEPSRKRKATSAPNPTRDVQLDQCGHFPMFQDKQQRCRHCKTGYSHLKCCKCEVHLCLVKSRNCFNAFHDVN